MACQIPATARSVLGLFSIRDYGAKGDGTTDDTAAIQAAVTAAGTAGGTAWCPPGNYLVNGTVTNAASNVAVLGSGDSTRFLHGSATGHLFDWTGSTPANGDATGLVGASFADFAVEPAGSTSHTAGYAIHIKYAYNPRVQRVRIGTLKATSYGTAPIGPLLLHGGVYFEVCGTPLIRDTELYLKDNAIAISGAGGGSGTAVPAGPTGFPRFGFNGIVRGCTIYNQFIAGSVGIRVGGGVGGLHISSTDIGQWERSIAVDTTLTAETNRELFLGPACFLDSAGNYGLDVQPSSLQIFHWTDVWAAGCGRASSFSGGFPYGAGINVNTPQPGFIATLHGGRLYANAGGGLQASAGTWNVTGVQVHLNGSGANGGNGLDFLGGSGMGPVNVSGCSVLSNGNATRGTGIATTTGMDNYAIVGNVLHSNGLAAIADPAAGAHSSVTSNVSN